MNNYNPTVHVLESPILHGLDPNGPPVHIVWPSDSYDHFSSNASTINFSIVTSDGTIRPLGETDRRYVLKFWVEDVAHVVDFHAEHPRHNAPETPLEWMETPQTGSPVVPYPPGEGGPAIGLESYASEGDIHLDTYEQARLATKVFDQPHLEDFDPLVTRIDSSLPVEEPYYATGPDGAVIDVRDHINSLLLRQSPVDTGHKIEDLFPLKDEPTVADTAFMPVIKVEDYKK
jgi:hypothetical protein